MENDDLADELERNAVYCDEQYDPTHCTQDPFAVTMRRAAIALRTALPPVERLTDEVMYAENSCGVRFRIQQYRGPCPVIVREDTCRYEAAQTNTEQPNFDTRDCIICHCRIGPNYGICFKCHTEQPARDLEAAFQKFERATDYSFEECEDERDVVRMFFMAGAEAMK